MWLKPGSEEEEENNGFFIVLKKTQEGGQSCLLLLRCCSFRQRPRERRMEGRSFLAPSFFSPFAIGGFLLLFLLFFSCAT